MELFFHSIALLALALSWLRVLAPVWSLHPLLMFRLWFSPLLPAFVHSSICRQMVLAWCCWRHFSDLSSSSLPPSRSMSSRSRKFQSGRPPMDTDEWRQWDVSFFCICNYITRKAVILRWMSKCESFLYYLSQEYMKQYWRLDILAGLPLSSEKIADTSSAGRFIAHMTQWQFSQVVVEVVFF